jgi:hypothetical protein
MAKITKKTKNNYQMRETIEQPCGSLDAIKKLQKFLKAVASLTKQWNATETGHQRHTRRQQVEHNGSSCRIGKTVIVCCYCKRRKSERS